MTTLPTFSTFTNDALLSETIRLAANERLVSAELIAALAEIEARRLYLGEGCTSLFVYCTRVLCLSEHAAYSRIEAARAARRFPVILDWLIEGAITLTTVTLLASHLTDENWRTVLEAARHKSKREVEVQVAALRPLPPLQASIRKLPDSRLRQRPSPAPIVPTSPANHTNDEFSVTAAIVASPKPAVVKPLAPEVYKVQFTISRETHEKLRRAQDLLRHSIPDGDPAKIFDKALTLLLVEVERKKLAAVVKPRSEHAPACSSTRRVPASAKRAVWKRDGGRCTFVGKTGRCDERGFLEFHHREPFAVGGATTTENLELRCRAHNAYEAELFFGPWTVREDRAEYAVQLGPDRVEYTNRRASLRGAAF